MALIENGLFIANVTHSRLLPREHSLSYKVYYLCFPLSRLQDLACRILSINRFNLFSFHEKDHNRLPQEPDKDPTGNEAWIHSVLTEWEIPEADGEIVLLTLPRVLGYVFNPVSFWFCLDKEGQLRAVLSEVSNTFGERHCYLSFHDDRRPITQDDLLYSNKVFHVSPFFNVEGEYEFRFAYKENAIGVWIDYYVDGQKTLTTALTGKRTVLKSRALAYCFIRYPMITLKVIAMIHVEAVKLIFKGIRYKTKPSPPEQEITR